MCSQCDFEDVDQKPHLVIRTKIREVTVFSRKGTKEIKDKEKKDKEIKENKNQTVEVLNRTLEGRGYD